MKKQSEKLWMVTAWAGVGLFFVTPPLFLLSLLALLGICSVDGPAQLFFPYAVIADPTFTTHPLLVLTFVAVQYPVYCALIATVREFTEHPEELQLVTVALLILLHILAVIGAGNRVDRMGKLAQPGEAPKAIVVVG